jgi:hypothetical protein
MGTENDWMWVAFLGMFWAGGMLLWEVLSRSDKHIKPVLSFLDVLSWAFAGMGFGLGITFRWKAFHWPLILFIILSFVGGGIFARLAKRKLHLDY